MSGSKITESLAMIEEDLEDEALLEERKIRLKEERDLRKANLKRNSELKQTSVIILFPFLSTLGIGFVYQSISSPMQAALIISTIIGTIGIIAACAIIYNW